MDFRSLEPGRKVVVVHEDDVGMTHGANTAFVELSEFGACSSGSVMPPCPWFPEAVELAKRNDKLDLGVHLTLTSEKKPYRWRPLTTPPASSGLTDPMGYFWPDVPNARKADPKAVETELRAQIDVTLASGIDVTHLDAHMGTALCPEFVDIYVRLGLDYKLPILLVKDYNSFNPRSYSGPMSNDNYNAALEAGPRQRLRRFRPRAGDGLGPAERRGIHLSRDIPQAARRPHFPVPAFQCARRFRSRRALSRLHPYR